MITIMIIWKAQLLVLMQNKNVIAADHMKGRVPMDYHQDVQIPPSSSSARMQVPQTYALKSNSSAGYHPNANMRGYNSNSQMTTHM